MKKIFYKNKKNLIVIAIAIAINIFLGNIVLAANTNEHESVNPIYSGKKVLTDTNNISVNEYIKEKKIASQGMTEVKVENKSYTLISAIVKDATIVLKGDALNKAKMLIKLHLYSPTHYPTCL